MTTQGKHGAAAGTEELRQEVDRARHDLGETVEQLAAKADVKAMAREQAARIRGRARETAESARDVAAWARGAGVAQKAAQGGIAVVSAGAVTAGAVWLRRRRAAAARRDRRIGPVRVRFRSGQRPAVQVRRRKRSIF